MTKHKGCVEPFVQDNGIDTIINILNNSNDSFILNECIYILLNVVDENQEYKSILIEKKICELLEKKFSSNTNILENGKSL